MIKLKNDMMMTFFMLFSCLRKFTLLLLLLLPLLCHFYSENSHHLLPSLTQYYIHRTFIKKQVSIEHSTTTLLTALSTTSPNSHRLTYEKAHNLSLYTKHQGFGVIGTWTREDCLQIGEMLSKEGLDCRVIPFNSALPSSSSLMEEKEKGVPTSSNTSLPSLERQVKVGEKPIVKVRSSTSGASYSSDYLLSLSP
jgi:hypothetical protein